MELQNKLILTFFLMLVVLYFIFNISNLRDGDIFSNENELKKPLIIALIGTLLLYLYLTWDNNLDNDIIPNYSIANNRIRLNNNSNPMEESIFLDPRFLNSKQFGTIW
jgi:hypothetical protein